MKAVAWLYACVLIGVFVTSEQFKHVAAKVLLRIEAKKEAPYKLVHSYYGAEFDAEFLAVCRRLEFEPAWLDAVFVAESNWNARAVNPTSGAVGFIQFLPETLEYLGSAREEMFSREPAFQLMLIESYYSPAAGRVFSAADLRLFTFYPAALGKPDSFVIGDSATAARNFIYDLNRDHTITVGEFRRAVQ